MPATEANMKRLEMDTKKCRVKEAKEEMDATQMKSNLEKLSLSIKVRAGEGDVLFGSVTSADIASCWKKKAIASISAGSNWTSRSSAWENTRCP